MGKDVSISGLSSGATVQSVVSGAGWISVSGFGKEYSFDANQNNGDLRLTSVVFTASDGATITLPVIQRSAPVSSPTGTPTPTPTGTAGPTPTPAPAVMVVTVSWGNGIASVSGVGVYRERDTCVVSCVLESGYVFDGWYADTFKITSSNPYGFTVDHDTFLVAKAKPVETSQPTGTPTPTPTGTAGSGTAPTPPPEWVYQ